MSYGTIIAPPMGYIRFLSDDQKYNFVCRLGDASPTITEGYGGWQVIERPRRRGLVEWKGNSPRAIEIAVLFDEFRANDGIAVEAAIQNLEKMAGLFHPIDGDGQPPLVVFHANGVVPYDYHDNGSLQWVIANVTWGDADRNYEGNRIRQAATITVWQHDEDHLVSSPAGKAKAKNNPTKSNINRKARHKTHTVIQGETLLTIAALELGNYKRWREIAKKNLKHGKPRRNSKDLKVGETLRMP